MTSFGEHLRRQREMRGISLDAIMATTKISRRLLQALEDEQFDLLPGGIFNKSYVRAYAKCVGMDEEEAVAEYLDAAQETPPDTRVIAHQHATIHSDQRSESRRFPLLPVLVLIVVAAAGVAAWKMYGDRQRERRQQRAQAASAEPLVAAGSAAATLEKNVPEKAGTGSQRHSDVEPMKSVPLQSTNASVAPPASTIAKTSSGPRFEVTVRPKGRAWVSIRVDGNYVVRGIIQPPEVRTIHAADEVIFYTGNAGAVDITFDGKKVPLSGGANQAQVLVFNSRGLQPGKGTSQQ